MRRIVRKFIAYVLCSRWANATEAICRRRSNTTAATLELGQQGLRHGMRGAAQTDLILPARNGRRNVRRAGQNQGQRAGPERRNQLQRHRR